MRWLDIFSCFGSGAAREQAEQEIQRKAGLSRRSFLKVLGVASVSVAVPGLLLPPPKQILAAAPSSRPLLFANPQFIGKSYILEDGTYVAKRKFDEAQLLHKAIFRRLASGDRQLEQEAVDAVNDFTRMKMREDGLYRRIMPPAVISNAELDAISIPFATVPTDLYIRGPRYRVQFDRIVLPKFTRDVDELKTWASTPKQMADARRLTAASTNPEERSFARSFWGFLRRNKKETVSCST